MILEKHARLLISDLSCLKAIRVDNEGPFRYTPSIGSTRATLVCLFFRADRSSFHQGKGTHRPFLFDPRELAFHHFEARGAESGTTTVRLAGCGSVPISCTS